jgi:hypothetical protein
MLGGARYRRAGISGNFRSGLALNLNSLIPHYTQECNPVAKIYFRQGSIHIWSQTYPSLVLKPSLEKSLLQLKFQNTRCTYGC